MKQNMSIGHQPEPRAGLSINRIYLLFYNAVCASLWFRILITLIFTLVSSPDASVVYTYLEPWTRFIQTLAVVEIIHAACGIVSCLPL
jgi:very-long-chain (3R)-3-hydroxyacyl-CoA dehydratase